MNRADVFAAIDSEREYQKKRWGYREADGSFTEREHEMEAYALYMDDYMAEMKRILSRVATPSPEGLAAMLKVVSLGIACFEQHGVPVRDPNAPVVNGRDGLLA